MTRTVRRVLLGLSILAGACGCSNNNSGVRTTGAGGSGGTSSSGTGGSSVSGTGGSSVSNGGCSIYQASCGGQCVTVATDPQNCGGCGVKCAAGQVCSGGGCTSSCATGSGLTACNGQCVNTGVDNNNCGGCGHPCGATEGCVGGSCVSADVFPPPASCAGGGPPVMVSSGSGAAQCAGLIAQTTFPWSVCSCTDVSVESGALIDGWDSTAGPYKPGQLGGGVGADNSISTQSGADIWGDATAASTSTSFNVSGLTVHHDLHSGGNVSGDGISITKNAYVAGNISSATIGGTLYQPANKSHPGNVTYVQQAVTVPPPCDCTNPIPVVNMVAWAKTNNDDASIGLDPGVMSAAGHPARIDLPCGVYYLTGFSSNGAVVAHGNVALFIDGSVTSSGGDLTITVADAASAFDVFVSGTIVTQSNFTLGNPNYPALTRLYIGGSQSLDMQASLTVGAEIWAGNATVLWEGSADVFGAIFAGNFQILDMLNLHHDEAIDKAGSSCPPPGGSGGGGGMCNSCKDCGNQACVNGACGQCKTDSDCCAPLACNNGQCISIISIP